MDNQHLRRGYFYAALTVAVWSGFILVSRLGGKSPLTAWDVTALRFGTAALILLPVWLWRRPRLNFSWRMVILAVTGGCGYGVLVYAGFKLTSAAHGAVLLPGMLPFLVALMAWLVLGERPSPQRWLGLVGIAAGIACLATDSFGSSVGDWRGDLLILASSLSWAIYTVLVRRWQVAPWDATLGVGLVSVALYLPVYVLWLPQPGRCQPLHHCPAGRLPGRPGGHRGHDVLHARRGHPGPHQGRHPDGPHSRHRRHRRRPAPGRAPVPLADGRPGAGQPGRLGRQPDPFFCQKERRMPYVNIKITREGATAEQKATLIRGVTLLLRDILGKNPETTVVTIDEVDTDNWGIGGDSVTVRRAREKKG